MKYWFSMNMNIKFLNGALGTRTKKSKQFMTRLMVTKYLNYGIFTNLIEEKERE